MFENHCVTIHILLNDSCLKCESSPVSMCHHIWFPNTWVFHHLMWHPKSYEPYMFSLKNTANDIQGISEHQCIVGKIDPLVIAYHLSGWWNFKQKLYCCVMHTVSHATIKNSKENTVYILYSIEYSVVVAEFQALNLSISLTVLILLSVSVRVLVSDHYVKWRPPLLFP